MASEAPSEAAARPPGLCGVWQGWAEAHRNPWLETLGHDELRALLARIGHEPMSTKKPLSAAGCARHTSNTSRQSRLMAWVVRWEGVLGATARCWAAGLAH